MEIKCASRHFPQRSLRKGLQNEIKKSRKENILLRNYWQICWELVHSRLKLIILMLMTSKKLLVPLLMPSSMGFFLIRNFNSNLPMMLDLAPQNTWKNSISLQSLFYQKLPSKSTKECLEMPTLMGEPLCHLVRIDVKPMGLRGFSWEFQISYLRISTYKNNAPILSNL